MNKSIFYFYFSLYNNSMNELSHCEKDRDQISIIKAIEKLPSNYVGSKRKLLKNMWDVLIDNQVEFKSVFDAFSGSAFPSLFFKQMGKDVTCNDLLTSSALSAICLLENEKLPFGQDGKDYLDFLQTNMCSDYEDFVARNYKDIFFTEKECKFFDRMRRNVELATGKEFYCGLGVRDGKVIEKWAKTNTTIQPIDLKNPFGKKLTNKNQSKYMGTFLLYLIQYYINQNFFLGGRYYNGQTISKLEHRSEHQKHAVKQQEMPETILNLMGENKIVVKDLDDISVVTKSFKKLEKVLCEGKAKVFNEDIITLLEANVVKGDLLYLDPPYCDTSSDYASLYRFVEEYIYGDKLENLEHIQRGAKRFVSKKNYREHFEKLLSLCGDFKTWLISYNSSSFADKDTITSIIKNAGKQNVSILDVEIDYQYRKERTNDKETEYLILAR